MATKNELLLEVVRIRVEMDCISGHCSECPYLIDHVCELEESVFMAGVDY